MTAPDPTPGREFTPSMERLRDEYVQMRAERSGFSDLYAAEFDRSLAQRDARIMAEAIAEALRSVAEDFDIEGRDVAAAELREWADVWQARS
jgi:hypothetical protein